MDRVINILIEQWVYDIAVMSNPWMYIPLLIPIGFYLGFFFIKWCVLTAPAWLPVAMVASVFRRNK